MRVSGNPVMWSNTRVGRRRTVWALLALCGAFGCARGRAIPPPLDQAPEFLSFPSGSRERAVRLARHALGRSQVAFNGRRYPSDCVGFIRGLYEQLGANVMTEGQRGDNGVTALYRFAERHGRIYYGGRPLPGDLVFFRDTYDQNGDGRLNDGLTHVGIVEGVERDGTVTIIHRVTRGVVRYRMNLALRDSKLHPRTEERVNDVLRSAKLGEDKALTAQLFSGYATLLPVGRSAAIASR